MTNVVDSNAEFFLRFGEALVWIAFWIGASILYRRAKGKVIFPKKPKSTTLFFESSASGNSNRNVLTKMGGARNCLFVTVNDDSLIVQPKFPFNLMFLPEIYGLEHNIPRTSIRTVVEKRGMFGKKVTVGFRTPSGGEESIDLRLRNTDLFLKILGQP